MTIRSYGAVSTTFRKRLGWVEEPPVEEPPVEAFVSLPLPPAPPAPQATARRPPPPPPDDQESDFTRKRRQSWAKLISKVYLCDPELCASCGERMKIVAALTSPHQDHVIERVLRHLQIWAPPWKRARKTRSTPPRHSDSRDPLEEREEPSCPEPIDPLPDTDAYAVDPPWDDTS